MPTVKLTKRTIDAATPKDTRYDLCDTETKGLRVKVHPSGHKTFQLYYRTLDGTERRPRIGTYGSITLEQARELARTMLAKVRAGEDPSQSRREARSAPVMTELCDRYLKEYAEEFKKESSAKLDRWYIDRFIKPALGSRKVASITRRDVNSFHRGVRGSKGQPIPVQANRIVALLSRMFSLAEEWEWRGQNTNPCFHFRLNKEKHIHRPLGDLEQARLGQVLRECREDGSENTGALDIIELLALTGCRRNEVVELTWPEVDLDTAVLRLRDSKGGPRVVWLCPEAVDLLKRQEQTPLTPYVFPGRSGRKPWQGIERVWRRVRGRANLSDRRLHDLRHSVGARAAALGLGQAQIGQILGHLNLTTTARYTEPHRDPAAQAAELVGSTIAKALGGDRETVVAETPVVSGGGS